MKTVVTFRGGGVRDLIAIKNFNRVNLTNIDLVGGTSAGAIIAGAISIGINGKEIQNLFINNIKKIFSISSIYKLQSMNGLLLPKYEAKKLEEALKDVFGNKKLKDCKIPFMCNAYDITNDCPIIFKSYKDEHKELFLWEVIKASCSAPTFFSTTIIDGSHLIDGGMDRNTLNLVGYI